MLLFLRLKRLKRFSVFSVCVQQMFNINSSCCLLFFWPLWIMSVLVIDSIIHKSVSPSPLCCCPPSVCDPHPSTLCSINTESRCRQEAHLSHIFLYCRLSYLSILRKNVEAYIIVISTHFQIPVEIILLFSLTSTLATCSSVVFILYFCPGAAVWCHQRDNSMLCLFFFLFSLLFLLTGSKPTKPPLHRCMLMLSKLAL